jgi:hypothetical protein
MPAGLIWKNGTGSLEETTFTALGVETIKVPAGTFDAVKVKVENISQKNTTTFLWFAKGVGLVKRYDGYGNNTWYSEELKSYSFPKQ